MELTDIPAIDIFLTRPEVIFKNFISCAVFSFKNSQTLLDNFRRKNSSNSSKNDKLRLLARRTVSKNCSKTDEILKFIYENDKFLRLEFYEAAESDFSKTMEINCDCYVTFFGSKSTEVSANNFFDDIPTQIESSEPTGPSYKISQKILQEKLKFWRNQNISALNRDKETLKTIDKEFYAETFENIKSNFTKEIFSEWNESTDPRKYIYEDVGIASFIYLLVQLVLGWAKFLWKNIF